MTSVPTTMPAIAGPERVFGGGVDVCAGAGAPGVGEFGLDVGGGVVPAVVEVVVAEERILEDGDDNGRPSRAMPSRPPPTPYQSDISRRNAFIFTMFTK